MFVYSKNSPTDLNLNSIQPSLSLCSVSRSLTKDPNPRKYSPTSFASDCSSSASATPPLHELHYWRSLCGRLGHETRRQSILDWTYWRMEAEFFAERVTGGEIERQTLQDSDYWKAEAQFWKSKCVSANSYANRHELADLRYWRCESSFWRNYYKGKEEFSPSDIRHEINEAPYWRCEYSHLSDPCQASASSDEPLAQPASALPPPNPYSLNASLISDDISFASPKVFPLQSVSSRRIKPRHFLLPSKGSPRRSKRLQAKQRKTTRTTETAVGTGFTGKAKVNTLRIGKKGTKTGQQHPNAPQNTARTVDEV